MIIKIWKDPVGSKVIAAGIIASLAGLITYFTGLWPTICSWSLKIKDFIFTSSSVPHWLIGIMAIPCILLIVSLMSQLFEFLKKKQSQLPWSTYNKDIFWGVEWHWSYDQNGNINRILSFCPKCNFQLIEPIHNSAYDSVVRFNYFCEECKYKGEEFNFYPDEIKQKVTLKIQKNIRTDEWKNTALTTFTK